MTRAPQFPFVLNAEILFQKNLFEVLILPLGDDEKITTNLKMSRDWLAKFRKHRPIVRMN